MIHNDNKAKIRDPYIIDKWKFWYTKKICESISWFVDYNIDVEMNQKVLIKTD